MTNRNELANKLLSIQSHHTEQSLPITTEFQLPIWFLTLEYEQTAKDQQTFKNSNKNQNKTKIGNKGLIGNKSKAGSERILFKKTTVNIFRKK